MRYTEEELARKLTEEIISLYEDLIGVIFKELVVRLGKGRAEKFFNKAAEEIECLALEQTPENKISLQGWHQDINVRESTLRQTTDRKISLQGLSRMEKDRIVSYCNGFISSLIVKIGEQS